METISNVTLLSGHSGPVKSVAFDALGEFLISAGCDETLRIWNVKTGESIKTLERTISPFDVEDMDPFVMAWHKSGKYVAIPGRKSDIVLIQRNSWTVLGSFKNGHIQAIVDVQWSHDGKYLASIGNDKKVCIWKMGKETKDPIATETHSAKLTGVAWCTQTNTLCLSDDQGRILYWENPTEKTTSSKKKEESGMDVDRFFDDQAASTDGTNISFFKFCFDSFASGDDEDGEDDGVLDDFIVDDDGAGYDMDLSRPAEFKKYQEQGKKKALKDLHRGKYIHKWDLFRNFKYCS